MHINIFVYIQIIHCEMCSILSLFIVQSLENTFLLITYLCLISLRCRNIDLRPLCFCITSRYFCQENLDVKKRLSHRTPTRKFNGKYLKNKKASGLGFSFTHNAVGDLPGIMQESEISPFQSLPSHFVSQSVSAVKGEETQAQMNHKPFS